MGLATATEAGAMGVIGAFVLARLNGRLTWALVYQGMETTMRITAMVIFILIGARVFSLVFQGVGGKEWIESFLVALPGGQVGFLVFVNLFVFIIAFFLDFFEIAFIIVPLLAPAAEALGINLIWFGVLLGANMQTSFMHPPFGFALFYLRGIAPPEIKSSDIYWGAIPWVVLQLMLVAILILAGACDGFPQSRFCSRSKFRNDHAGNGWRCNPTAGNRSQPGADHRLTTQEGALKSAPSLSCL